MVGISELSKKVASTTNTTQKKTAEIITAFLKETVESVNAGNKVNLADFGIFERKEQKERVARNPKTREEIKVPAKDKFVFRASSAIKYKD
ncbi:MULTISPECIES: HU family DNA-binding protein [Ferroplasma]|jgi:DNA-binding protein HU-beta|uniref:DNA-binding protein n=2 Tax=Ferroplasma TaxID=74968 RepID=S0AQ66_FERAC|nr:MULTISPECIES: HU family DNA-binding protein [Ferroplasma]AGO61086.1 DNA-binding protein [Ferroplasma acidarmanus Fer1]ARD84064.1 DNA-binding protein [Ferroplasma acidiphilum]WMT52964.1 MAG: HU family DNA-binding protein [Ferroplasma acidiphilum]